MKTGFDPRRPDKIPTRSPQGPRVVDSARLLLLADHIFGGGFDLPLQRVEFAADLIEPLLVVVWWARPLSVSAAIVPVVLFVGQIVSVIIVEEFTVEYGDGDPLFTPQHALDLRKLGIELCVVIAGDHKGDPVVHRKLQGE